LIPWFQTRYHNGGLGVCVGGVVSEVFMVGAALFIAPEGTVDASVGKSVGKAIVAGAAMFAAARALGQVTPFIAAPLALLVYFGCLWLIGGIDREQVQAVRVAVSRKIAARVRR